MHRSPSRTELDHVAVGLTWKRSAHGNKHGVCGASHAKEPATQMLDNPALTASGAGRPQPAADDQFTRTRSSRHTQIPTISFTSSIACPMPHWKCNEATTRSQSQEPPARGVSYARRSEVVEFHLSGVAVTAASSSTSCWETHAAEHT